ncbi:hypothetical protein Dimus_035582 [Dionaea muscipula]
MNVLDSIFFGKRFQIRAIPGGTTSRIHNVVANLERQTEAAAIGGVARKREDLIIVNIDEAYGDDELVCW